MSPPESPTTARPFELDDDDAPEPAPTGEESRPAAAAAATTPMTTTTTTTTTSAGETSPPAPPPRPLTEQQKNELILKEAFPTVEPGIIKAVLSASRGQIEPAFNALLGECSAVQCNVPMTHNQAKARCRQH